MPTPLRRQALLRQRLDSLVESFDVRSISPDPLELVLAYHDPRDQEVAGLLAAAFAYGRADIVVTNVGRVLRDMTPGPFTYLRENFTRPEASKRFAGFRHRFHKTPDLVLLLGRMARILELHGSLGRLFEICYDPGDRDIGPSLERFAEAIIGDAGPAARKRLAYLITSPRDGSACKRMNLLLRWMIRRTPPDLGLWTFADPAKLVMPLDTHVHRITAFLGLNSRRSADWKAARLLTDRLARFAPSDPVRYDFAICRLGILDLCSRKRRREQCEVCLLKDVCRLRMV